MKSIRNFIIFMTIILLFVGCKNSHKKIEKSELRFVFLGDTRGNYKLKNPVYLNEKVLIKFVNQIITMNPKPKFVIFNGDMVAKTAYTKSKKSIERWNEIFTKPIQKAGIKIFITPGNHIIDQKKDNVKVSASNYIERFNKDFPSDNPQNGPDKYKGVTYSFDYENIHFVTTTSFVSHRGFDNNEIKKNYFVQKKKDFEYFINRENRDWLLNDLEKSKSKFKIFFTHCPLYPVGPHYKDKKSLHAHEQNRKDVLSILNSYKVDLFLASHEHMYARVKLGPNNPKNSGLKKEIYQITLGSASAPMKKIEKRESMKHDVYTFEYDMLVADLVGNFIECNVYDENINIIDNFKVTQE